MRNPGQPALLAGRFRLDSLLGQGGMGTVHRATDLRLEREVAVKVVRAQSNDAETRARFVREAQRTAQVRHPNVVEVFDVGETPEGELFLVMELLRGVPLSKRLARVGRLDSTMFASIAPEICAALGAAHSLGIVHRDVKPANVMLVEHGSRHDFVKVVDFGIAKAESSATALTDAESFIGTLEYTSPEQLLGDPPLGVYSDVYSLGVMFYLLLTGSPVFRGVPSAGLVHHHLEVVPEPLRARAPAAGISEELEAVVLRCLAKAPSSRYANANELGQAIEAVVAPLRAVDLGVRRTSSASALSPLPRATRDFRRAAPPGGNESPPALSVRPVPMDSETVRLPLPLAVPDLDLGDSPRIARMTKRTIDPCSRCGGPVAKASGACPTCGEVRGSIALAGIAGGGPAAPSVPPSAPGTWEEVSSRGRPVSSRGSPVSSRRGPVSSRGGPGRSGHSAAKLCFLLAMAFGAGIVALVMVDANFGFICVQIVAFFVVLAIGGYFWVKQA